MADVGLTTRVAKAQGQVPAPPGEGGPPDDVDQARVRLDAVSVGGEALDADLKDLFRFVRRGPEDQALIGVVAGGGAGRQVEAGDGRGEVGPQADLLPAGGLEHEEPRTQGFPGQVEDQGQGLQDRRLHPGRAGGAEGCADGLETSLRKA